jgi:hypothetical protein
MILYWSSLVPYSGGSSLEANFSAPHGGMSIDFSFMDQIVELHADELVDAYPCLSLKAGLTETQYGCGCPAFCTVDAAQ